MAKTQQDQTGFLVVSASAEPSSAEQNQAARTWLPSALVEEFLRAIEEAKQQSARQQRINELREKMIEIELILCGECAAKMAERDANESELWIEQVAGQVATFSGQLKADFKFKLLASFESEPLEDGMDHPAEEIIFDALKSADHEIYLDWLREFALDKTNPSLADSVLVCLARQSSPGTPSWRINLIEEALHSTDVRVRDAAVEASESWADPDTIHILKKCYETEPVGWLRDYMQTVVNHIEVHASKETESTLR